MPSVRRRSTVRLLAGFALGSALASQAQAGVVWTWPATSGPCAGTLQACVDATAPGTLIEITTEAPVDENLVLPSHSLALTAASAFKPRFANGRRIVASYAAPSGIDLHIEGIAFDDGGVTAACYNGGHASVQLRDLTANGRVDAVVPTGLAINASNGCTITATVTGNRIVGIPADANSGLIHVVSDGGTVAARVTNNHVTRAEDQFAAGSGILVAASSGANIDAQVVGNHVSGAFGRNGIRVYEGLDEGAASTLDSVVYGNVVVCPHDQGDGIDHVARSGTLTTYALNNTVSGCRRGIGALGAGGGSLSARINGLIVNNLLAVTSQGMAISTAIAPDLDNDHNLIDGPPGLFTPGPNTIIAPARLVTAAVPRLRADSPAIDAADGMTLADLIIEFGLTAIDADGLRRVKGGGADIGAYESGDVSLLHVASAGNTGGHITRIDHPASNGNASAAVLPTRAYRGGARVLAPYGVYFDGDWTIYHDNLANVPANIGWTVWLPASGGGVFTHSGTAANTSGWSTRIDNGATNGQPGRIVLAAHNWSGSGNYNPHNVAVYYSGSGAAGRWHVANVDQAALPVPNAFNIYSQPASANAFRLPAPLGAQRVDIDHALVNGVACAQIHATRVVSSSNPGPTDGFDLDYNVSSGRWGIYSPAAFTAGTAFNVVIDPAQVFDCTDRVFADDFE